MVSPGFIAASVLQEVRGSDQKVDATSESPSLARKIFCKRISVWKMQRPLTLQRGLLKI